MPVLGVLNVGVIAVFACMWQLTASWEVQLLPGTGKVLSTSAIILAQDSNSLTLIGKCCTIHFLSSVVVIQGQ